MRRFIEAHRVRAVLAVREPRLRSARKKLTPLLYMLENAGNIISWQQVLIYAYVCGRVKEVPVKVGEDVAGAVDKAAFDRRPKSMRQLSLFSHHLKPTNHMLLTPKKLPGGGVGETKDRLGRDFVTVYAAPIPGANHRDPQQLDDQNRPHLSPSHPFSGIRPLVGPCLLPFEENDPPVEVGGDDFLGIQSAVVHRVQQHSRFREILTSPHNRTSVGFARTHALIIRIRQCLSGAHSA
ncbi:unnamed protein product [Vitrella brassicaformis CCMP3155]|uniref:Uncharacterized protein n=1 Tax=Vitrella brassicaformis (strain CCMP3155) TaxID=1169540 RepID=A0A0G4FLS8_VITBC|nr:unnamed protein product [Vitrella brassicaformis CCMP3155]|eukprot:CEM14739.1 unnamed protein product [Vitrella brassicaformis CCMP3155]